MTKKLLFDKIKSPLDQIIVVFDDNKLCALDYVDHTKRMEKLLKKRYGDYQLIPSNNPNNIQEKLDSYFLGNFDIIKNITISISGTNFQKKVWQALLNIPAGNIKTYKNIAQDIGNIKAVRAVGYANSLNPIAIIIPCHRVIASDGNLRGYAGGLRRKKMVIRT